MYKLFMKRFFDLTLSLFAIVMLSPIILVTAILVRCKIGSPVLFRQQRPGKNEKIFEMVKFRTMTNATDQEGNLLSDEDRLTKLGRLLRSTSLDELPELFNIVKGDMSIVGPRPLLSKYLPFYTTNENRRHELRPGLTGLSQVSGRNLLEWDERLKLDVTYVDNVSFLMDCKIILLTIKKVIIREDVVMGKEDTLLDFDEERKKSIQS